MALDPDTPDDPARETELAERGRAMVAAAVADTRAPLGLRERLERDRERGAPARRRRRTRVAGALAGALAVIVVAIALLAPGGSPGAPGIVEAARTAVAAPERPAPSGDPAEPRDLALAVDGIAFPTWRAREWRATGVRDDEVDGRRMTTVHYRTAQGADVTYSIVAGQPLDALGEGRTDVVGGGTEVHSTVAGARRIIAWEEDGHTCIVTAPRSIPLAKLLELPAST